jgi:hypothetical protein
MFFATAFADMKITLNTTYDVFFHVRAILQTQTLMLLYTTKNSMIVDCLSYLNLHCKSFIHIPTSEQKSFVNVAYSSDDVS